jgi:hypothetical protein
VANAGYGIARFVGSWVSASGYRLRIKKVRKDRASVDFLDPRGAPIQRSYMKDAPSVKMIARYDDYNGTFEVTKKCLCFTKMQT